MLHRLMTLFLAVCLCLQNSFAGCSPVDVMRKLIKEVKDTYRPNRKEALYATIQTMCKNVYGIQKCLANRRELAHLIEMQYSKIYRENEVYALMGEEYAEEATSVGAPVKINGRMERRMITYYDDKTRAAMVTGVGEAEDGTKVLTQFGQPLKGNR